MSGNFWNRLLGGSMVDMEILSHKVPPFMPFRVMGINSDTLHWSEISWNRDLLIELDFITDFYHIA